MRAPGGGVQGVWRPSFGLTDSIPTGGWEREGLPGNRTDGGRPKVTVEIGTLGFHPQLDKSERETELETRRGRDGQEP